MALFQFFGARPTHAIDRSDSSSPDPLIPHSMPIPFELRRTSIGSMLLNQFIIQTENKNRGSPLSNKQRLMMFIEHFQD
jgi:hypothetical protein